MVDLSGEAYGFLRWPPFNFNPCPEDVYVPASVLKRFGLRPGHKVKGFIRAPRDKEKFMALEEVVAIEGIPIEQWTDPNQFTQLPALSPPTPLFLSTTKPT